MGDKALKHARYLRGLPFFGEYDSGTETLVASTPATITPDAELMQILIYPMVASKVKFNSSEKEVYLPAEAWTPITLLVESFILESAEAGDVHWIGYYI